MLFRSAGTGNQRRSCSPSHPKVLPAHTCMVASRLSCHSHRSIHHVSIISLSWPISHQPALYLSPTSTCQIPTRFMSAKDSGHCTQCTRLESSSQCGEEQTTVYCSSLAGHGAARCCSRNLLFATLKLSIARRQVRLQTCAYTTPL